MGSFDEYSKPSSAQKKTSPPLTLFGQSSNTENAHSGAYEYQGDSCPSDCESGVTGAENEQQQSRVVSENNNNGLIRIGEGEGIYEIIKKKLETSLSACGFNARIEAVLRNDYSGIMSRAKLQSFGVYSRAMEMKCGCDANVRYAWYGASKREIDGIVSHGFGIPTNASYGLQQGVCLSPADRPLESMQLAAPDDDDGLRHMLLCRVILGKLEVVCPDSGQSNPSSEAYDSGVDNLASPKKYVVWTSRMNTHILPEFVVSFRASSYRGCTRSSQNSSLPSSDWMPFPTLIAVLSKFLPTDAVELIAKHHGDYKKHKMSRHEMIQSVRHIAGDKLLLTIIKSYRAKIKTSWNSTVQKFNKRN